MTGYYDEISPEFAVLLAPDGRVLIQLTPGPVQKHREWFWTEGGGSQNPLGLPGDIGLVRTRYSGRRLDLYGIFAAMGHGFLSTHFLGDSTDIVRQFNAKLEVEWKRAISSLTGPIVSPSWAKPMLFHDTRCFRFVSIDGDGHATKEAHVYLPEILDELDASEGKKPRFAIGQDSNGDWLLIAY
ncbi:MAG TPA: hypothetical protein VIM14_08015 [Polyangia bacterium]